MGKIMEENRGVFHQPYGVDSRRDAHKVSQSQRTSQPCKDKMGGMGYDKEFCGGLPSSGHPYPVRTLQTVLSLAEMFLTLELQADHSN